MPLGKPVFHSGHYHPEHLFPIPRENARKEIGIASSPPFVGTDIWNAYEISWLDTNGKPGIAIGTFFFPSDTAYILESKSVKLYLNSFNQSTFPSLAEVAAAIEQDFSAASKGKVAVTLMTPDRFDQIRLNEPKGFCLDHADVKIGQYLPDPDFLVPDKKQEVRETVYSNLFRTNCPVTGQPDWATVIIEYAGRLINREGLLRYLVSFREHSGFHENCVERIFMDISKTCKPEKLTVYARFTRRGGIDINPFRSDSDMQPDNCRFGRQ